MNEPTLYNIIPLEVDSKHQFVKSADIWNVSKYHVLCHASRLGRCRSHCDVR